MLHLVRGRRARRIPAAAVGLVCLAGLIAAPPSALAQIVVPLSDCADSDNGDPDVTGVALGRRSIDVTKGARRLPFTVTVLDTGGPGPPRGVSGVDVSLTPPTGAARGATLRRSGGDTWTGAVPLAPGTGMAGTLKLTVSVRDHAGRLTIWHPEKLRDAGLENHVVVRDRNRSDQVRPRMTRFSVSRSSVDTRAGSRRVIIRAQLRDDLSGVGRVVARLRGDNVVTRMNLVHGTARDGTWVGSRRLTPWIGSGPRDVVVLLSDRAGNRRAYGRDSMAANDFTSRIRVQALTDTTPPVIEPLSAAPSSLDVRDSDAHVPLRLRATDTGAGVARVWVRLHGPYGDTPVAAMTLVSGTPADGVWESDLVVPRCGTRSGTYLLTATAVDRAGARRDTGWVYPVVDVTARDNEAPAARTLFGGPALLPVAFSEDVTGISAASAAVSTGFGTRSVSVGGQWTCSDASGAAVDCQTGPVRRAQFRPTSPLVPAPYIVELNPNHVLDIQDASANPLARARLSLGTSQG